jgi:hypothetical protein
MSKKQHHRKDAGQHDAERRRHDAAARHEEEQVYREEQPKWMRYSLIVLAGIVVASLTLLFAGGFIRW